MHVRADYRRWEVSARLVRALIEHCVAHQVKATELWAAEDGPGRFLYARLGFHTVPAPGEEFEHLPEWRDDMRMRLDPK